MGDSPLEEELEMLHGQQNALDKELVELQGMVKESIREARDVLKPELERLHLAEADSGTSIATKRGHILFVPSSKAQFCWLGF